MVFDVDEITEGGLGFDLTVAHDKFKIDHRARAFRKLKKFL